MSAIQKYLERHDHAVRSKSKEMRLDMEFAGELSSAIAVVLSQCSENQQKVIELQQKVIDAGSERTEREQDIILDGGNF